MDKFVFCFSIKKLELSSVSITHSYQNDTDGLICGFYDGIDGRLKVCDVTSGDHEQNRIKLVVLADFFLRGVFDSEVNHLRMGCGSMRLQLWEVRNVSIEEATDSLSFRQEDVPVHSETHRRFAVEWRHLRAEAKEGDACIAVKRLEYAHAEVESLLILVEET